MFRIWLDSPILDSVRPMLDGVAEVVGPNAPIEELATCDAALDPGAAWTAARMDLAPRLKVLSRIGVGYDNIDVAAATARGILVCYAPLGPTLSTAEHAVALIFAAAKTVTYADREVRAGHWHTHFLTLKGMELRERVLGLVGLGRIGIHVARIMQAVGMRVIAVDPMLTVERAAELGLSKVDQLEDLLAEADVVSLHAPATPETLHLMNATRLQSMKPGAILINTARGSLIDETALADALKSGHLSAAGLDVFEREPVDPANPLLKLENVVLTDHIASHTWAGHHRLYEMAVRHALQALRGEKPDHQLNGDFIR
ncbi:MAG: hydroxyacid dehydrogenase [Planctomycetaceae bacterium]|nr:hydroxyacid dehydrogenase [Planctomycetaceae bacterium]MCA9066723.1 hydroxyacid dehydrogenase [Planctomycetaceae bacterium]